MTRPVTRDSRIQSINPVIQTTAPRFEIDLVPPAVEMSELAELFDETATTGATSSQRLPGHPSKVPPAPPGPMATPSVHPVALLPLLFQSYGPERMRFANGVPIQRRQRSWSARQLLESARSVATVFLASTVELPSSRDFVSALVPGTTEN